MTLSPSPSLAPPFHYPQINFKFIAKNLQCDKKYSLKIKEIFMDDENNESDDLIGDGVMPKKNPLLDDDIDEEEEVETTEDVEDDEDEEDEY